jgi:protein ImuA
MLSRTARRAADTLPLLPGGAGGLTLTPGRVHEFCGPARRTLAALALSAGGQAAEGVVWIAPSWAEEELMAGGLAAFLDPGRLLIVRGKSLPDLLWAMEEALRSGAGAVVADLPEVPDLTPMRRLQLAAEAGGRAALALALTPGEGGAAGAATRWSLAPAPADGWQLVRLRARLAPPAAWHLVPTPEGLIFLSAPEPVPLLAAA